MYVRGYAYALRGAGVFRMVWPMHRPLFTLAAILGALSVILGAFGAHGLTKHLAPLADGALRLEWWKTAAHYHLTHALAVGLAAGLFGQVRLGVALRNVPDWGALARRCHAHRWSRADRGLDSARRRRAALRGLGTGDPSGTHQGEGLEPRSRRWARVRTGMGYAVCWGTSFSSLGGVARNSRSALSVPSRGFASRARRTSEWRCH